MTQIYDLESLTPTERSSYYESDDQYIYHKKCCLKNDKCTGISLMLLLLFILAGVPIIIICSVYDNIQSKTKDDDLARYYAGIAMLLYYLSIICLLIIYGITQICLAK